MSYIKIPGGSAPNYKPSVPTISALPTNGNQIGDIRAAEDTLSLYIWDGNSWETVASPGGSSNSFAIIQVPNGTNPTATSATDTLTFTSTGNTVTITGDSTTDTINLEASGGGGTWGSITGTLSDQTDLFNEHTDLIDGDGSYYFTNTASDQGGGRLEMTKAISPGGGVSEIFTGVTNGATLSVFCTGVGFPNATHLPAGPLSFNCFAQQTAGTQVLKLYAEFYVRETPGGTEYLLGTTPVSEAVTGSATLLKAHTTMQPYRTMNTTDRLVVKIKAEVTGVGTAPSVDLRFQGVQPSRAKLPCEPTVSVAWGAITGTLSAQTDLDTALDGKQDDILASNNQFVYQNGSGVIEGLPGWSKDATSGGLNLGLVEQPNNVAGNFNIHNEAISLDPIANSPNEQWTGHYRQINIDTQNDGFSFGTNGSAVKCFVQNVVHDGESDIGAIEFLQSNFALGNGTDPIDVKGVSYAPAFGTINANVNVSGPMQGFGFQFNANASATIASSTYSLGFYDGCNIACASPNHTSFSAGPTIASIQNNNNYQGLSINPNITTFTGNSSAFPISINGNWGTFGTGSWNGIQINPTITDVKYAAGLNVSMDNVTLYAGTVATLVIQDLTIATDLPGSAGNSCTFEYTPGGTAGSEVVSGAYPAFQVQIDSGVSTATQIAAALNGYVSFTTNFNVTISGVGSNTQVTQAATSMAGGTDPGRKQAAYLDGDVEVTGALTFGGALSIGQLNAFVSQPIVDAGGTPTSLHSLITSPTVAANVTVANGDTLGVNTAMLLTMGDNAVVTTSFVGCAALALPAVVSMGTGATIDQLSGATYALSLDGAAAGGTIGNLDLCRSLAIPNGVTTVTNLRGYKFDLPFGDPGTTSWGFYESPGVNNYFQGNLLIGGTAGSDDTVTNASVALEIKSTTKAFMNARMTTAQRNALTAVNGMQIYNSSTDKLQVYAAGAWTDLH